MKGKFHELIKSLPQSVTRRPAIKRYGVGLAGIALACFGLAHKAAGASRQGYCKYVVTFTGGYYTGTCLDFNGCVQAASADCPSYGTPLDNNGAKWGSRAAVLAWTEGVSAPSLYDPGTRAGSHILFTTDLTRYV